MKNLSAGDFSTYHDKLAINALKPKISPAYADYNLSLENVFQQKDFRGKTEMSAEAIRLSHRHNLQIEQENADRAFTLKENYWQRIARLIELAESKRIEIYFFIPPRLESERELETVFPIYKKLARKYKLAAAHDDETLYREDVSLDDFHLNFTGAKLFTEKMSEAFKKRGL